MRLSLNDIPKLPQRQDSTLAQFYDLYHVAKRIGCYDAADVILNRIIKVVSITEKEEEKDG